MDSLRFVLTGDDFRQLVRGGVVTLEDNDERNIQIILADIGYLRMADIIGAAALDASGTDRGTD